MTAQPVAAFDFDGTLSRGDSLSTFLVRLIGPQRFARTVARHSIALGLVGLGQANRDLTKERFIAHALTGHPASQIDTIGKQFADDLINERLFPGMIERV